MGKALATQAWIPEFWPSESTEEPEAVMPPARIQEGGD